jgi:hypothetical protein
MLIHNIVSAEFNHCAALSTKQIDAFQYKYFSRLKNVIKSYNYSCWLYNLKF